MERTCPCANPPGGDITCNVNQLAICGVIDGKLVVGCFDPPLSIIRLDVPETKSKALANWTLSRILCVNRDVSQDITEGEFGLLRAGHYVHPETGHEVKFAAPDDLDLAQVWRGMPLTIAR